MQVSGSRVVIAEADNIARLARVMRRFRDFSLRGRYVTVLLLQQLIVIAHLVAVQVKFTFCILDL